MRVSRAQAEANRETVINVASQLFREHGFDGIGLKDLMKGAGLTQGGFYKQFESKDDLAALASRRAMENAAKRWSSAAAESATPLESIFDIYLSEGHREDVADGCPLIALGSDAARQSPEVRRSFQDGIEVYLRALEGFMPPSSSADAKTRAMAVLSLMAGAVTISRVLNDEQLSGAFLEVARAEVARIAALEKEA